MRVDRILLRLQPLGVLVSRRSRLVFAGSRNGDRPKRPPTGVSPETLQVGVPIEQRTIQSTELLASLQRIERQIGLVESRLSAGQSPRSHRMVWRGDHGGQE